MVCFRSEMPSAMAGEDDIVLSGLAGRLPESDNLEEFAQQLLDGVDLVTADGRRWTPGNCLAFTCALSSSLSLISWAF